MLVAAVLILGLAYLSALITHPSDGTAVAGIPPFSTNGSGIRVGVLDPTRTGVRSGDVVVAIDGRDVDSWAGAMFQPSAEQTAWHDGERLTYTVLRHGRLLSVQSVLGSYPLRTVLDLEWGPALFALAFLIVAAYVFVRRPADRLSIPLLLCASSLLTATLGYLPNGLTDVLTAGVFWLYITTALAVHMLFAASLLHVALLFPRPHPVLAGRRWMVSLIYGLPALGLLLFVPAARISTSMLVWIARWGLVHQLFFITYLALVVVVIASTYRLRRDFATRQQIRWVVYGGVVAAGGTLLIQIAVLLGHAGLGANAIGVIQLVFPVTLAVAILRYHLFDIDTIINRTLVYGSLTAILAAVYFVLVVAAGTLLQAMTGRASEQPLVIVLSTLLIAALFQPLRRRLQHAIDRRFYRHKYDAARTLAAFGASLRGDVELSQLATHLVEVVDEAMKPATISLWLNQSGHSSVIPPAAPQEHDEPPGGTAAGPRA